jgi:cytochrome P450
MRALLGLDPDEAGRGAEAADHFERALGYYGIDYGLRLLRGPGSPWRKMIASREVLDEIVFGEVAGRRAEPDPSRKDILSLLVGVRGDGGEAFTDREVRDQVMTLMFAGHDTSTSTLTFMMHELARHPEVVERLCEEQDRVLTGGVPTIDQLEREMPYLEMVLDEVLRLYPPVHFIDRRPLVDVELDGVPVAAGSYLLLSPLLTHRDPRFFGEPEAFRPERWGNGDGPHGRAYFPFGAGPHTCIGMALARTELALVVATLASRWRLRPQDGFPTDPSPQTNRFPMILEAR